MKEALRSVPLRTWLVILMVATCGLGILASSAMVSSVMKDDIYQRVDEDLYNSLHGWARDSELFTKRAGAHPPSNYTVIKIFDDGSSVVFNDLGVFPDVSGLGTSGVPETVHSVGSASSAGLHDEWRAIATQEHGVMTVVARNLDREDLVIERMRLFQGLVGVMVLIVIALVGWWLIRRALRPLRVVERTARDISEGQIDRRVPEWPMSTEVGQLGASLNIMLNRLQRSLEHTREKEEQMRRFVGDASHELRTPLTSLRGYTELYRSGAAPDADWVIDRIEEESTRMTYLVEDLLSLTRAEGNALETAPVDLLETASSVATQMRETYPGRTVRVINQHPGIPVALGQADKVRQIILNLVANALVHGGEEAQVSIVLRPAEEAGEKGAAPAGVPMTEILIIDDGCGMSPEDAEHIFERFYRADSSRSRNSGGSGLGLAIVHSLVERHGGTITVQTAPGEGSTFTVALPAGTEEELFSAPGSGEV
ncbi:HAMP domain-containing histidine kinase [Corynebacterium uropygiale]|uniref:histidine kinase n=1 Tax=Corynebacterium uropygiale TaxID=1775911 RepID=A0A9X1U7V2_9CORY|nr:HAMP domain-containing histidine kinase [Corynebacterium uropygiale]